MRFPIFTIPLLSAAALHGHGKFHKRAHTLAHRAIVTDIVTVTVSQVVTVTVKDDIVSATPSSAASIKLTSSSSAISALPTFELPTASATDNTKPFATLEPVSGSAMILNSCDYHVYVWSTGDSSCTGEAASAKLIDPNESHIEPFRICHDSGISLKVSKTDSAAHPMQFEYSVWPNHVMVSYDISYLDCMVNSNGEKDLSNCAGHDGGIQASGGGDCPDYHCLAGEWCDVQAYVVAEFGYLPGAPVGGCTVDKGIAFELCALKRG